MCEIWALKCFSPFASDIWDLCKRMAGFMGGKCAHEIVLWITHLYYFTNYRRKLLLCLRHGMLSTSCEPVSHRNTQTHCKGHGTSWILLLLSKVATLYKLASILIATYSVGGYVSIKATVYTNHLCVCVCGGTASVSLTEHNVQFDSHHDDLNDLWRLLPLATLLLHGDKWLERRYSAWPSGKEEQS